jgi:hypothetical protein
LPCLGFGLVEHHRLADAADTGVQGGASGGARPGVVGLPADWAGQPERSTRWIEVAMYPGSGVAAEDGETQGGQEIPLINDLAGPGVAPDAPVSAPEINARPLAIHEHSLTVIVRAEWTTLGELRGSGADCADWPRARLRARS